MTGFSQLYGSTSTPKLFISRPPRRRRLNFSTLSAVLYAKRSNAVSPNPNSSNRLKTANGSPFVSLVVSLFRKRCPHEPLWRAIVSSPTLFLALFHRTYRLRGSPPLARASAYHQPPQHYYCLSSRRVSPLGNKPTSAVSQQLTSSSSINTQNHTVISIINQRCTTRCKTTQCTTERRAPSRPHLLSPCWSATHRHQNQRPRAAKSSTPTVLAVTIRIHRPTWPSPLAARSC